MDDLITLINYFDRERKYCLLGFEQLFWEKSPMRLCYIRIIKSMNEGIFEFEKFATEFYGKRVDALPSRISTSSCSMYKQFYKFSFSFRKGWCFP